MNMHALICCHDFLDGRTTQHHVVFGVKSDLES